MNRRPSLSPKPQTRRGISEATAETFRWDASGCLPELDVVGLCIARRVPAGWHVIGNWDCACEGVWIPHVVGGHSVGNNGAVRTAERMYGGIQCPLSVNQPRLRWSRCIGSDSYCGASVTPGCDVPIIGDRFTILRVRFSPDVVAAHRCISPRCASCTDS